MSTSDQANLNPGRQQPGGPQRGGGEGDALSIACKSCGAELVVASNIRSTVCPYCASPSIVERPPTPNRPVPTFVVGFVRDHEQATNAVKQWITSRHMFVRSDFKRASPELTRGVYLPAYLYSAISDSQYSAEIGENYTETETYTTTDSNGKPVIKTRTVTKTEYRSLQGRHEGYLIDIVVSASRGVANAALEAIEPFDLRAMRRYEDGMIAGWIAEEPSRTVDECMRLSHEEAMQIVQRKLQRFMPGDSHRNLRHRTNLHDEMVHLILLPIWSFALRYAEDQPPLKILVNGQTGRVNGDVPISYGKIALAVGGFLLVILILFLLFGGAAGLAN